MMKTGECFRFYSAETDATNYYRISDLWEQIIDQINKKGEPASNCYFLLKFPKQKEVTMDEITGLCDLIQKVYTGDIMWDYEKLPYDELIILDIIG